MTFFRYDAVKALWMMELITIPHNIPVFIAVQVKACIIKALPVLIRPKLAIWCALIITWAIEMFSTLLKGMLTCNPLWNIRHPITGIDNATPVAVLHYWATIRGKASCVFINIQMWCLLSIFHNYHRIFNSFCSL